MKGPRLPGVTRPSSGTSPSGAKKLHDLNLVFRHPNIYDCKERTSCGEGSFIDLRNPVPQDPDTPTAIRFIVFIPVPARAQDTASRYNRPTANGSTRMSAGSLPIRNAPTSRNFPMTSSEISSSRPSGRAVIHSGAPENTFKEEHYRRIAYANQHFAAGIIPGWKTDRGRFYIMYGPPDKVIHHLSSDMQQPDGVQKRHFDSEEWHWTYIEGLGCDVVLEFVDTLRLRRIPA